MSSSYNTISNIIQNFQLHGVRQELVQQADSLRGIDSSVSQMSQSLDSLNQQIQHSADIQKRQLLVQQQQQQLLEKQEIERQEQRAVKQAVFAIAQNLDDIDQLRSMLTRLLRYSELSEFVDELLVVYISKLDELTDKQYASQVLKRLRESIRSTFEAMTQVELNDWSTLQAINGELADLNAHISAAHSAAHSLAQLEYQRQDISGKIEVIKLNRWERGYFKNAGRNALIAIFGGIVLFFTAIGVTVPLMNSSYMFIPVLILLSSMLIPSAGVGLWLLKKVFASPPPSPSLEVLTQHLNEQSAQIAQMQQIHQPATVSLVPFEQRKQQLMGQTHELLRTHGLATSTEY